MYGDSEEIMLKTETLAACGKAADILQIANLISKQGFWGVSNSGVLLTVVVCGCVHLSACLSVHCCNVIVEAVKQSMYTPVPQRGPFNIPIVYDSLADSTRN